ncbi:MAG: helix-turn-helix transcriptional regulator, partial [Chloroflexia bacterium]|nr:helix-turn-helix transcriptional regulator [Chloroflexia bacterium]
MSESRATFGDLLRHARRDAELTQEELAERAGVSARTISDLERGVIRAPRRDTLAMLVS